MKFSKVFWLIGLIFGVRVVKPVRRIKRTRSVKCHFVAKGLAKKTNPYNKKKSKLLSGKKRKTGKRRTPKRKVTLFRLRRRR